MELLYSINEEKLEGSITLDELEYGLCVLTGCRFTISGALDLGEYFAILKKILAEKMAAGPNKFPVQQYYAAMNELTRCQSLPIVLNKSFMQTRLMEDVDRSQTRC